MTAAPRSRCRLAGVFIALTLAASTLAACSSDAPKRAQRVTVTAPEVTVAIGQVVNEQAGGNGALSDTQRTELAELVRKYVQNASVQPFVTGKPVEGLDQTFTTEAVAAINTTDRAVLTDTDLPRPTGNITMSVTPAGVTALFDANSTLVLASAFVEQRLQATTASGPVAIRRIVDFTAQPCTQGCAPGALKVRSYSVSVTRTLPDGSSTTTTAVKK